tara:strand:+ start:218 stop:331 length:114 start_codon:yes stop_codon:yes gene_type:complete
MIKHPNHDKYLVFALKFAVGMIIILVLVTLFAMALVR